MIACYIVVVNLHLLEKLKSLKSGGGEKLGVILLLHAAAAV